MIGRREFISSGILALMGAALGVSIPEMKPKVLHGWMCHGYGIIDTNRVLLGRF